MAHRARLPKPRPELWALKLQDALALMRQRQLASLGLAGRSTRSDQPAAGRRTRFRSLSEADRPRAVGEASIDAAAALASGAGPTRQRPSTSAIVRHADSAAVSTGRQDRGGKQRRDLRPWRCLMPCPWASSTDNSHSTPWILRLVHARWVKASRLSNTCGAVERSHS